MTFEAQPAIDLVAPRIRPPSVRRPRLERLLADGTRRPVTVLSAPPGTGKTTLLMSWFDECPPGRATWVTIGGGDHEPLDALLRRLSAGEPHVLVVDDAHHLDGVDLAALVQAIERPGSLDLVVSSRADLPLGIGRLRQDQRVAEIRGAALAFTPGEAQQLLVARGVRLRPAEVQRLHARTEGWAAGLRLMACALERGVPARRLVEDDRAAQAAVSDYLLTEVLNRESPELLRFLLRTSVAERLSPELAVLLSDDDRGGDHLDDLHQRGIFVVALDDGWYRYHALFAALLRARLRMEDPATATALHRTAARWFLAHNLRALAQTHAQAGDDWYLVGDLLRSRWRDAVAVGDFDVRLTAGLSEAALRDEVALGLLAAAERPERPMPAGAGRRFPAETAVVTRLRACRMHPGPGPGPGPLAGDASGDPALAPVAGALDAELRLGAGDIDGAITLARRVGGDAASPVRGDATAVLAVAMAVRGSHTAARGLGEEAVSGTTARVGRGRLAPYAPGLISAICELQRGRPLSHDTLREPPATGPAVLHRTLAAVRAAARTAPGVAAVVEPALAADPLARRVLVALGVLEVDDTDGVRTPLGGEAEEAVRRARYALATGSTRAAQQAAARVVDETAAHPRTRCEAAILVSVAARARGDRSAAGEHARIALAIAGRTQVWAPILLHGGSVVAVIGEVARDDSRLQSVGIEALELLRHEDGPAVVEELTDRERAVLRFLPTLMSNDEIALTMHLSVNTVKTHLKTLYRKLGVRRRRDAVLRAKEQDLL
jgi:LuxR family maltose regulon positive regulatory protein